MPELAHRRGKDVVEKSDSPNKPDAGPEIRGASAQAGREDPHPNDARVVSRRWFLFKASIALNGIVGVVLAVPIVRYLLGPWRKDASYNSWVSLGAADSFPAGETRLAFYKNPFMQSWDGATDNVACYVRRLGASQFQVFAINCAHLGCPVRWFPQSQLFMCPCHGGVYYADGSRASGPPERGLFTYNWQIVSGELRIDAGQTPTLSNTACLEPPKRVEPNLVQIKSAEGDTSCRG
jgi:nitrite reductase/ring-hydroxylating ferredoxin subunit